MTTKAQVRNFRCLNTKAQIVVSGGVSIRVPLPRKTADVMIINPGPMTAFIRSGSASVEADLLAMPILSGEKGIYGLGDTIPPVTHIAVLVAVPAQAVTLIFGEGA